MILLFTDLTGVLTVPWEQAKGVDGFGWLGAGDKFSGQVKRSVLASNFRRAAVDSN